MARRARGHKLAIGIYRDAYGLAGLITVKGHAYEKRFPPDYPLLKIQQWQADERAYRLACLTDDGAHVPTTTRGTLAADVAHYLTRREGRAGYKSDRSHLHAWTARYGARPRHQVRPHDVELAIAAWRTAGKSETTIRHRVRVLKDLWRALDGARTRTPADALKLPPRPRPDPQGVPQRVLQRVAASMARGLVVTKRHGRATRKTPAQYATPAKGYARFLVRALTGQRADQIMKAKPGDVDLEACVWSVRPAKGGTPIPLPLSEECVEAWRLFIAADAWGRWDWRSFAQLLRRHGWPKDIPPKNLRHTFAIDHLHAGTDLGDLQGLLGHRNIQTTRTYYAPVLLARLQTAVGRRQLRLVPKQKTG